MNNALNLENYYTGVMHFHSRYSHDGHDAIPELSSHLKKDGIDFCVLTDHFEDFDAVTFGKYVAELETVNALGQTLFVPAVEAEFKGFHVILLPVSSYHTVRSIMLSGLLRGGLFKILAHPTKYNLAETADFLRANRVDGVEVWNQQADGKHLPPARFFRKLMTGSADLPAVFFGNDIHNMHHRISNLLLVPREGSLTVQAIVEKLRRREFINYNRLSGLRLSGSCSPAEMQDWLDEAEQGIHLKARTLLLVKKFLKFPYSLLPRPAKQLINDFKNTVKNKL